MLSAGKEKASPNIHKLKARLEESWGSHERLIEEISKKPIIIHEDNYDEDEFEKEQEDQKRASQDMFYKKEQGFDDDDNDKILDEEFNLSTSGGKKDSDFMKELMKPPIRTKYNQTKPPLVRNDEGSGDYNDEIDDFIKKHIESEEKQS